MIPESLFQRIKDEADIVKIISEYIKLEKKSSSYIGLCPFHPDQNPSLHVSPSKKIYKCFSCGAAGDVIRFVENYEKVPFSRAVQIVGEKSGINVELAGDDNYQVNTKYYNILQASANFYHFLLKNTVAGEEAKKYLYKRNLNDEIIKRFNIGLAGDEIDLLYKSLLSENFQPLDMIEAGVIRGTTNYYDVFRSRIMFPLDDINGKIVGFSGRVYKDIKKEDAKYLNSFENKIFKKGNILYNFSKAQNSIRNKDSVFVFEGFMDVIAAYRCNIYNAVATMGTSISQNQINSLKKTTNNIVLCYDGDTPGIEASKKAIMQFLRAQFNVNALLLPEGIDPDDYINKYGEDKLADFLLNSQISGYDYLYETSKMGLNLDNLNSIEIFKKQIFEYLVYFKSSVLTERFLEKLANDLNVSIESLKDDFSKSPKKVAVQIKYVDDYEIPKTYNPSITSKKKKIKIDKYINASKNLIKIAYYSKEQSNKIRFKLDNKYVDKTHNSLLAQIYEYYNKNEEMSSEKFKATLSQVEINALNEILDSNFNAKFLELHQDKIDEYVRQINLFYKEQYKDELKLILKNDPTNSEALAEYGKVLKEIKEIKNQNIKKE